MKLLLLQCECLRIFEASIRYLQLLIDDSWAHIKEGYLCVSRWLLVVMLRYCFDLIGESNLVIPVL